MKVTTKFTIIDYPHIQTPNTKACETCTAHDLASCEAIREARRCEVYPNE